MDEMFQEIMIWKRLGDAGAIRYACLNDLNNDKFAVQSADFFRSPAAADSIREHAIQFVELFTGVSPRERCTWFASLAEAISHHDREFK